ncbi:nuclear transport factor 2 family protein [Nocardioides litoris]|uniref:nuclear transport factor 2 family protein n=1 Tax=Nocardioides litoris TaxID=1926648 RepID=UPI001476C500|nr:nuclear transport factor 2 family protein [Nocardioides litoris]
MTTPTPATSPPTAQPFTWSALPAVVQDYLRAHVEQDFATAVTHLPDDVVVVDNGETLEGRAATLTVFEESAELYDVTTTLLTVARPADDTWEVGTHLSGTFPGGEVDLRMLFTLVEGVVRRLEITA